MNDETFTIGTLAKRAGVNVQTVRYYERIGILPKPSRAKGGYRHYGMMPWPACISSDMALVWASR